MILEGEEFDTAVRELRKVLDTKDDLFEIMAFLENIIVEAMEQGATMKEGKYLMARVAGLKFEGDDDEQVDQ